jgi:hypothetical protein
MSAYPWSDSCSLPRGAQCAPEALVVQTSGAIAAG